MKKYKFTRRAAVIAIIASVAVLSGGFAVFGGILDKKNAESAEITAIALTKTNLRDSLSLSGTIHSDKTLNVYSTLNYPVKEVYVKEGDRVSAGDILAVLDVSELEYEIMLAENNYESALQNASEDELSLAQERKDSSYSLQSASLSLQKATLEYEAQKEELLNNTSSKLVTEEKNVSTAEQSLENAKTNLDLKKQEYENNKLLFEAGAVSKSEFDSFENSYNTAVTDLNTAERLYKNAVSAYDAAKKTLEAELRTAKNNMDSASVNYQNAQSNLNRVQSKTSTGLYSIEGQRISLEKLKAEYEDAKIIAGITGVITEVNAVVGASPSGILFVIEDDTDLYASINVKEYNLAKVKTGRHAIITTDVTGNSTLNGEVSYISPKAIGSDESTTVEFETHVKLNENDDRVKIGMNAFVNITVASVQDVYSVTSDMIVHNGSGEQVVYALQNGVVTEVPVTTGLETATGVEISGRLEDGMLIITNPSDTSPGNVVNAQILETARKVFKSGENSGKGLPGGAGETTRAGSDGQTMMRRQGSEGAAGEMPQRGTYSIE